MEKKRPWKLLQLSFETGAIKVESLNGKETLWVSPDDLVGGYVPSTVQKKKRQRLAKEGKKYKYSIGLFQPSDAIYPECWYVRGKLRAELKEDGTYGDPVLFQGESVSYCPGTRRCIERQLLEWCSKTNKFLRVTSRKDKGKIWRLAWQAENEHANKIREEQKLGLRRERSSGLGWRPLQPVYVMHKGPALLVEVPDQNGWGKVIYLPPDTKLMNIDFDLSKSKEVTEASRCICLIGHENEPIDLDEFWRREALNLPLQLQKASYGVKPNHLLQLWRDANKEGKARIFEEQFDHKVRERQRRRVMAMAGISTNNMMMGKGLPKIAVQRLDRRASQLLQRLQEDFRADPSETMMEYKDFKERIIEIKYVRTRPNMLLLCGGFAPEVTAYKRLNIAPLGVVIIQDTDLFAVGVAVAAHPEVEFAIVGCPDAQKKLEVGDVRILRKEAVRQIEIKVGGIDMIGITNPCQSFSLAGKKEGFLNENGQLFHDCVAVQRALADSSDAPFYLAENVNSTKSTNDDYDAALPDIGAACFNVCASICSPSCRVRKFATNRPPPECPSIQTVGFPPCLNGDSKEYQAASIVSRTGSRFIHPGLKKLPCLMHSNPARNPLVWEISDNQEPERVSLLPEEAERAMGYRDDEIGITKWSAEAAVRNRIALHDYGRDGPLISLKGCASDSNFPVEEVDDARRLALLGNSQVVTLLEAMIWREQELYPPFCPQDDH